MKKIIKIVLLTIILMLPIKIMGACTVDDKVRYLTLSSNVTTSYDYVEDNDKVTFSITIHNVHKDLVVKDNINNRSYSSNRNDLNNYTINNLKDGVNYSFDIYAKSGDCSYRLLNTLYVNLPKYNKYYKDSICDGASEFNLCQKWGETGNLDYETFKLKVEEYKKKISIDKTENDETKKEESIFYFIGNFWAKYYLYITIGIVIVLLPIIIIVKKKNRYDF